MNFKGHYLVVGDTGSGKGVLVSGVAAAYRRQGIKVFLLTSKDDEYAIFPADFKTKDAGRFLAAVMNPRRTGGCMAVIDEAWSWKWQGLLEAVPNSGRSRGVEMWVQGQRAYQTPPTCRNNCSNIFCFYQKPSDRDIIVKDYGDEFREIDKLKPGQYVAKFGMEPAFAGRSWHKDQNGQFRGLV